MKAAVQAWAADAFACPQPVLTLGYLGESPAIMGVINSLRILVALLDGNSLL